MLPRSNNGDERSIIFDSQMMLSETESNHVRLHALSGILSGVDSVTRSAGQSQPEFVSKMVSSNTRYTGAPAQPLSHRFRLTLIACQLCVLDVEVRTVIFPMMEVTFLQAPALVIFMNEVILEAQIPVEAIRILESYFSEDR